MIKNRNRREESFGEAAARLLAGMDARGIVYRLPGGHRPGQIIQMPQPQGLPVERGCHRPLRPFSTGLQARHLEIVVANDNHGYEAWF